MFVTLEDPRAAVQGSRDPLGAQMVWAHFGRKVVTNLTTVSASVRAFTTLLLGRYLIEQLLEADRIEEDEAISVFMRWEQIAAYAQYVILDEQEFRGVRRARRFVNEYGKHLPISDTPRGMILADQKTYGVWGLYSAPARVSGLIEDGPIGLTAEARDYVEGEYSTILQPVQKQLLQLLEQDGWLNAGKNSKMLKQIAHLLRPDFTASERQFYGEWLRDARHIDDAFCSERQARLAPMVRRRLDADAEINRSVLLDLEKQLDDVDSDLRLWLNRIRRLEATLAPAEALFEYVLAQPGRRADEAARQVAEHWGDRVPNLDEPIASILSEVITACGDEQANLIEQCDCAMASGDYREAIRALLTWNEHVMEQRGGAPWVCEHNGTLDVRYGIVEQEMPGSDDLADLWRNSYFMNALLNVVFQLENRR